MNNHLEETKELWRTCFSDSDEFVELYFKERYEENKNFTHREDGKIVAALQAIEYPMLFDKVHIPCAYLSGVCTHPDYRDRGIMRRLMAKAHEELSFDFTLSALIPAEPWLFDYYASMGYVPVLCRRYVDLKKTDTVVEGVEIKELKEHDTEVFEYSMENQLKRNATIIHNERDMRMIIADVNISNGIILTAWLDGKVCGMAIAYRKGERIEVEELIKDSDEIGEMLVNEIVARCEELPIVRVKKCTDRHPGEPFGMVKILSTFAFLSLYAFAHPSAEMKITVTDSDMPENNGNFIISAGRCRYLKEIPQEEEGNFITLTAPQLCEEIMLSDHPFMNLMLN